MLSHERDRDESLIDYILRALNPRTSGAIDIRALSCREQEGRGREKEAKRRKGFYSSVITRYSLHEKAPSGRGFCLIIHTSYYQGLHLFLKCGRVEKLFC